MKLLHHAAKKDWEDVDKAPAAQQSTVCWARFEKKSKFRAKPKGRSSYRLCFEYFPHLLSILNWFRNAYIISSCFITKRGEIYKVILTKNLKWLTYVKDILLCYIIIFRNSCWLCNIHFWINWELRRVGKNIQNKD